MNSRWTRLSLSASMLVATASCGPMGSEADDEVLGSLQDALNPGNDAQFISSNIPTTMYPGERLNVQVTMRNTGSMADGSNTWGTQSYTFARTIATFGMSSVPVATTPVDTNRTFAFILTAPGGDGTFTFGARMKQDRFFGEEALVPNIDVSSANTPRWRCTYLPGSSNVPLTMSPGENRFVTIAVQNTGGEGWAASGFVLRSQDSPAGFWRNTSTPLKDAVLPGATHTFGFSITAPAAPGSYSLRRQMQDTAPAGVGVFNTVPCVDLTISVGGSAGLSSSLVSHTFPTPMAPGETRAATVTLTNTGTQPWLADGNYALSTRNTPASLWGITAATVTAPTAMGANRTLSLTVKAPMVPGSYNQRWQMRKLAGVDAGFFGETIDIPILVGASAPDFQATVVSQDVPLRLTAGEAATFSIRMRNSGASTWTGPSFALYSRSTPSTLWGLTSSPLGATESVAANAERTFDLNVTAPATPGSYASDWQMQQLSGAGAFGAHAVTTGVQVTLCGNGVVDGGETCDDDNLVSGDGCSDTCQTEGGGPFTWPNYPPPPEWDGSVPQQGVCSPQKMCWSNPLQSRNNLYAVWSSSPTDVWVAGSMATLAHYDGSGWTGVTAIADPTGDDFFNFHMLHGTAGSSSNVWAVGWPFAADAQSLFRFDGTHWTEMPAPSFPVRAIWATGTNEVWTANEGGYVSHWNGSSWVDMQVGHDLQGIYGFSNNDVWVSGTTVLQYNGTAWVDRGGGGPTIWGATSGDMWTGNGAHLVGSSWAPSPGGIGTGYEKVIGTSATNILFFGTGDTPINYHRNGATFLPVIWGGGDLHADVWPVSPTDYWVVGERDSNGVTILHGDPAGQGVAFTASGPSMPVDPPPPYRTVGTTVQKNVGGTWVSLKTFSDSFVGTKFLAFNSTKLWVCNGGQIHQYAEETWLVLAGAPTCSSAMLQVDGGERLWVAQFGTGLAIQVFDGETWTVISSAGLLNYFGAYSDFTVRNQEAWALAQTTAYRFNGTDWDEYSLGVDHEIATYKLFITADGTVYTGAIAGSPQIVWRP